MKKILTSMLPPVVLALILSLLYVIPSHPELMSAAVSPDLPLDTELDGWYGVKTQESEKERDLLASDTKFSKGLFYHINPFTFAKEHPSVSVSIVYYGYDLNNSIHRPERCLPSQGHLEVIGKDEMITLPNGRSIALRRLDSRTPIDNQQNRNLHHIHYYVFVSNSTITNSHMQRTWQDICDRVFKGKVQKWAYIQIGTYWGDEVGISEQKAEALLKRLTAEIIYRQVEWEKIEN